MSHTHNPPTVPVVRDETLTRNGVTVQLTKGIFSKKNSFLPGHTYLYPKFESGPEEKDDTGKVTKVSFTDMVKFAGEEWTASALNSVTRKECAAIFLEHFTKTIPAVNPDGSKMVDKEGNAVMQIVPVPIEQVDWNAFKEDLAAFDEGADTLSSINEQIDEYSSKVTAITESPDFGQPHLLATQVIEITRLNALVKPLREKANAISEIYKTRAAKRKEAKEKREAEEKALADAQEAAKKTETKSE